MITEAMAKKYSDGVADRGLDPRFS